MRDDEHDLTPEQEAMLGGLPREAPPPAELEERVVNLLRERALIRPASSWRTRMAVAALFVIGLSVAYFAGLSAGGVDPDEVAPGIDTRPMFALLVYDPPQAVSAEGVQAAVQEASTWAGELARSGVLMAAEKLRDDGSRVVERGGEVQLVADFPPPEATLVLGGFFLIRAADYQEAQRIAADCPLLRFGSTIEVRAFEEV